jgi:hypothetical protein
MRKGPLPAQTTVTPEKTASSAEYSTATVSSHPLRRGLIVISIAAVLLTATVTYVSTTLALQFLENYPYFFDAAAYSYFNAFFYSKIQSNGVIAAVWDEICHNGRSPLRTIPLALFAPSLLANPVGHVATSVPALLAFLVTFGIAVFRRSQSVLLAVAAMLVFCSLNGVFDCTYGFATYWLDFTAALWAGAAALSLVNSDETRSRNWVIAFSIFAACATLSRYISAGFIFFSCLPVLLTYSTIRIRKGDGWGAVLKPYAYMALVIGVLAGTFLIVNCRDNFEFYRQCCYSLNQAFKISLTEETWATRTFFQDTVLSTMFGFALVQILLNRKASAGWHHTAIAVWLGISTHVLLILVLRANGGGPQTYYCVPLLTFALLSPVCIRNGLRMPFVRTYCAGLIALSVFSFVTAYGLHSLKTAFPPETVKELKAFDVAMGDIVAKQNKALVWNEFFDERAWLPTMEAFYKTKKFCIPAGQLYFTIHESGWTSQYPNLTPQAVASKVINATNKLVELSVVFDDPEAVTKSKLNNDYSKAVAAEVAREMRRNAQWKKLSTYDTKEFGRLGIYWNTKVDGNAFSTFIERKQNELHPLTMK